MMNTANFGELLDFQENKDYLVNMDIVNDVSTVDDISEQTVLNNCISIVANKIRLMGLRFHVPITDLLDNYYDANAVTYLAKFYTPEILVRTLVDHGIVDVIEPILDDPVDEVIRNIFVVMANEIGSDEYIRVREFLFDKVVSTSDYVMAVRTLLENVSDDSIPSVPIERSLIDSLEISKRYIDKMILKVAAVTSVSVDDLDYSRMMTCNWLAKLDIDIVQMYLSTKSQTSLVMLKDTCTDMVKAHIPNLNSESSVLELLIVISTINTIVPVMTMIELESYIPQELKRFTIDTNL